MTTDKNQPNPNCRHCHGTGILRQYRCDGGRCWRCWPREVVTADQAHAFHLAAVAEAEERSAARRARAAARKAGA